MPVIKNAKKLKWAFIFNEGFTLVELLLVTLILGIIAAVVLPNFKILPWIRKTLPSSIILVLFEMPLNYMPRNIMDDGEYPNAEDHNIFVKQLINYTNMDQQVTTAKSLEYPYGPYLKNKFPETPLAEEKAIRIPTPAEIQNEGNIFHGQVQLQKGILSPLSS